MNARADLYDLLLSEAHTKARVKRVVLGLCWSFAELNEMGLCWSPAEAIRTNRWAGTLRGRDASELTNWVLSSDGAEAAVGACVMNAAINERHADFMRAAVPLAHPPAPHLAVFAHFRARVQGARVVVIGRYPGLDQLWSPSSYVCIERKPAPGVVLERDAQPHLSAADWVFITASSIANHSLPTLLAACRKAEVVLMGPSLPWMPHWQDLGVDHLAGVVVQKPESLVDVVSEAGGTRLFDEAVGYRLISFR